MNFRSTLLSIIILLVFFWSGMTFYKYVISPKQDVAKIDSTLIIERIEKVMKLISVEGHYTEMLNYNKTKYDIPGFRKKALVEVSGKVSVGYNLENLNMKYDTQNRILEIDNFPEPEIISIESNTRYFDLEQGLFNSFSKDELTEIDQKSKEIIRQKALNDHLIEAANQQKEEIIAILIDPLLQSGWDIKINGINIHSPQIEINKK